MFSKNFLKKISSREKVSKTFLEKQLNLARIVIPANKCRDMSSPVAIGEGLKVKINTNIGLSTQKTNLNSEIKKMREAVRCGTHTVMDLSVSPNYRKLLKEILALSPVPVGTVPVYEVAIEAEKRRENFDKITFDDIYQALKRQAEAGVDFFTIHAGILKKSVQNLIKKKRVGGIVSRGGALLAHWMYINKKENPLYANFEVILELAKKYNITISLGDALRPGAIADSTDSHQIDELKVLGELVQRCRKNNVQVMVEGPGHIRLDEIPANMALEKKICHRAPFYILGPLTIDCAPGYDHIVSAVGGTVAAFYGADFLCVVTPAEHLRHPSLEDITNGVIASRIAAHSVDVLRFKDEWQKNLSISKFRARRDWRGMFNLAVDPKKAKRYRKDMSSADKICSMCGKFCSLKITEKCHFLK
ncbi:MAG: phosphomethylpyrimidine synthase ThiC [Candidatus Omnitrophica bacterium]|nr:phosphomethylpyrimidine synthase ThiC [Candidatus Omnitrophota bacterium]MDD5429718.1 phosphomethylpyrimidine synthase ThiC [Candidatus Omnitrophota bacterium]